MRDWLDILKRFQTGRLLRAEWTHEAHLVIGLWYLLEYRDPETALTHLRLAIMAFNESIGDQNTDTTGYHHTITAFWLREIDRRVQRMETRDFATLAVVVLHDEQLLHSPRVFEVYPRSILKDPVARRGYVPPPSSSAPA